MLIDIMRRIEFSDEYGTKYKRGLFCSQLMLGRFFHLLKEYGGTIFEIIEHSVKSDIHHMIKKLLEQHGVQAYFESNDQVVVAAMCNGGDLAWKFYRFTYWQFVFW
jgi:hypothetical protein